MKIIAVNIKNTVDNLGALKATERAWKLQKKRADLQEFVVGVKNGKIYDENDDKAYFKLSHTNQHTFDRIEFVITPCSPTEINDINSYILNNKIGLKRFITKYL